MKKNLILIALSALILPALLRSVWFYQGIVQRPEIATPDYQSFHAPEAPLDASVTNDGDLQQYQGIVLLDRVHGNQFRPTEVDSLTGALERRGGQVEQLTDSSLLEDKLKYSKAFISISPIDSFSSEEIRLLKNFANRGGRILVFTDATRYTLYYDDVSGNPIPYGDVNTANALLAPFGISINNDYLYDLESNEGNFRNVRFENFSKSELTFGLKEATLYGTHSVESSTGQILLQGVETTLSSINDANDPEKGGAALSQNGNVAAFGDLTFLTPPYHQYADNAVLIANLAEFALTGQQEITLQNFPHLFTGQSVQAYLSKDFSKTAEMIASLGRLQESLRYLNVSLQIVEEFPKNGDAILITSLMPSDEFTPLFKKYDLDFGEDSGFITLPGFGEVGVYGNGVLLFNPSSKGNQLTLLTENADDMTYLLDLLSGGSLYNCLSQELTAVCSVGDGGYYEDDDSYTEESDETLEEPTPTGDEFSNTDG